MEEQLERDKLELQNKIDIAEQRLDKRVQNLERRTESRLSQLKLHQHHLTQWLRNEVGLHRTRSLDMLLENELSVKMDAVQVEENPASNADQQPRRSMDDLSHSECQEAPVNVLKDSLGKFWRSQFLRSDRTKCPDLVSSLHSRDSHNGDSNPKRDSVLKDRSDNYALDVLVPVNIDDRQIPLSAEWKRHQLHRSVHEIVTRTQFSNSPHWNSNDAVSCRGEGEGREEGAQWCGVESPVECKNVPWRRDISSDSSDGEEDDHARSWQEVKRLPYRSRSAVYSPPLEREPNDSGYSTKICSNSQGPSPSLSGINVAILYYFISNAFNNEI